MSHLHCTSTSLDNLFLKTYLYIYIYKTRSDPLFIQLVTSSNQQDCDFFAPSLRASNRLLASHISANCSLTLFRAKETVLCFWSRLLLSVFSPMCLANFNIDSRQKLLGSQSDSEKLYIFFFWCSYCLEWHQVQHWTLFGPGVLEFVVCRLKALNGHKTCPLSRNTDLTTARLPPCEV